MYRMHEDTIGCMSVENNGRKQKYYKYTNVSIASNFTSRYFSAGGTNNAGYSTWISFV